MTPQLQFWLRMGSLAFLIIGGAWGYFYLRRRRKAKESLLSNSGKTGAGTKPGADPTLANGSADLNGAAATTHATNLGQKPVFKTAGFMKPPSGSYIFSGWDQQRRAQEDRLPRIEPGDVPTTDTSDYTFGPVTPMLAAMLPESDARRETVKTELRNAGYYQPHVVQNMAAIRYLLIILPLLIFGGLLIIVPKSLEPLTIGAMVVLAIFGWALPRLYVRGKVADRKSEIERSLPDVLDMLNMCVSQGMTLLTALTRVNQELQGVYPALSQELKIVAEQARIGTLEQALQNFNERVDVPDIHSFTTLLIQTERMGTSISTALSDYSQNMRESLRQRADEKANQATFKLLFPTVLCLMPAVYMFLLGPAIVQLSEFFNGGNSPLTNANQSIRRYNNSRNN